MFMKIDKIYSKFILKLSYPLCRILHMISALEFLIINVWMPRNKTLIKRECIEPIFHLTESW